MILGNYYYKLCYGHQLAINPELNNLILEDNDIFEYSKEINNKTWKVKCEHETLSCVFGTIISCSYRNRNYCDDVRNAKESDYQSDYQLFLDWLLNELKTYPSWVDLDRYEKFDSTALVVKNQLKEFLLNNKPKFYMVEAIN